MKKVLLATTVLASLATVASAETGVTISGYGRFGLTYDDSVPAGQNSTTVHTRLRMNVDATTETDSGVTFGGRFRIQHTDGQVSSTTVGAPNVDNGGATINAAMLYTSFEGLRVEVGNVNTAYDSAALMYDPEMGFTDSSFGDPQGSFYSYSSTPYANESNRMGVFASYSIGAFTGRLSYVTADQTGAVAVQEEVSISADYSTDMFVVSAAAVQDGAGVAGNDQFFVGAAYKGLTNATIGLNYLDEDTAGNTIVLYGNYAMGATTLKAYVSNNDNPANLQDTGFGIGADYDLGGARLSGSVQRGYADQTVADLGVRFDF